MLHQRMKPLTLSTEPAYPLSVRAAVRSRKAAVYRRSNR